MAPARIIFLAVILFTWGTIEALEPNSRIPNFAKGAENPTEKDPVKVPDNLPVGLKSILPFKNPKEFNSSGIIPKELKYGQAVKECGNYTLNTGDTAIIRSKNYPNKYPRWHKCQWEFRASSPDSRISMFCPVFRLSRWKFFSYVKIRGGNFHKTFFGKKDGLSASSTTNSMQILFRSRLVRAKGFECYVTASVLTTFPSGDCKCGHVSRKLRIVGGKETKVHEYPWQVAITTIGNKEPYCGGSIISDQWILTAAHCMDGEWLYKTQIVIGLHDWTKYDHVTASRFISKIIMHPDYNNETSDNDIALVKLMSPIKFSTDNKIAPVCLPPPGELYENVDAIVTGWGDLSAGGSQPDKLHGVTVPTMTNKKCKSYGRDYKTNVTMNEICAGLKKGGEGPCHGDSGGPLVTAGDATQNFMIQIGVVSWQLGGCAAKNSPGVYARVNRFLDWIAVTTAGSTTCPSS